MSTVRENERIPALTLGWRLKMSLGDMRAEDMADQLGVSRQTLSRWMADRGSAPKRAYLLQWALVTGVPVEWLMTGERPAMVAVPTTPDDALARLAAQKMARHAGADDTRRYARAA